MQKIKSAMTLADLDSWGTVVDLGSEILEGECKAYGKFTVGNPEVAINGGYFGVSKGVFRMTYPFSEQATVVSGNITLTNEDSGEKWTFGPGESWVVEQGTTVLWEIHSDYFVKHYLSAV
ncbi:MAG: cupin domain-containing protein [Neisseriaceae bacterium]